MTMLSWQDMAGFGRQMDRLHGEFSVLVANTLQVWQYHLGTAWFLGNPQDRALLRDRAPREVAEMVDQLEAIWQAFALKAALVVGLSMSPDDLLRLDEVARRQAQAAYQTVYEQTLRELAASLPASTPDPA
jgi:hypothetical protein